MVRRIWEETLGKIHTKNYIREGTTDDIPFEFQDPDNPTITKMEIGFAPLDISTFRGYSNELPEVFWHSFKGDHDNDVHHVEWFMTLGS